MSSEMASEVRGVEPIDDHLHQRAALRLAFGVASSFVLAITLKWDASFLGAMLAVQLLVKLPRPPALAQGVGIVIIISAAMLGMLFFATRLMNNPMSLILSLALFHLLVFSAHLRGAPEFPTLILQIAGVAMPVIVITSPELASTMATALISAGVVSILTVWAAYAVFPLSHISEEVPPVVQEVEARAPALGLAIEKTIILMPVLSWYVLDASQVSVVVLITIITLLRLLDPHLGWRTAFAMVVANLIGAVTASFVYTIVDLRYSLAILTMMVLGVCLVFAGRIVTSRTTAPIYTIAFATFILLLGIGLAPLPGSVAETAATRVINVGMATVYAASALTVFQSMRGHWIPNRVRTILAGLRKR